MYLLADGVVAVMVECCAAPPASEKLGMVAKGNDGARWRASRDGGAVMRLKIRDALAGRTPLYAIRSMGRADKELHFTSAALQGNLRRHSLNHLRIALDFIL